MNIAILILLIGAPVAIILPPIIVPWSEANHFTRIKFKSFVKFYNVNPDRWNLYDEHVECRIGNNVYFGYEVEKFSFNIIDFYRYKLWRQMQKRAEHNKERAKATSRMIAAVRRDIDKQNELAKSKQDKAITDFLSIFKNCYSAEENSKLEEILRKVGKL